MNDTELDQRIAEAVRVRDADVAAADLGTARDDLSRAIVDTPGGTVRPARGRAYRRVLTGVAAAGVAAAIAVPLLAPDGDTSPGATPTVPPPSPSQSVQTPGATRTAEPVHFSLAAKKLARRSPRVLLDAPGWVMADLSTDGPRSGSVTFRKGPIQDKMVPYINPRGQQEGMIRETPDNELEANWYRASKYASFVKSRTDGTKPKPVTVLGRRGILVSYGKGDYAVLLPPNGDSFVEFRGTVGNEAAFRALLRTAREVDVDTWLRALPASFVLPGEEAKAVRAIAADIPLPPGLKLGDIRTKGAQARYYVGADVTSAITCKWMDDFRDAKASGDTARQRRATRAMATSKHWKILSTMRAEGDWSYGIWEVASDMAHGKVMSKAEAAQMLSCGQ